MFEDSLGRILEIIKVEENFRIQIITREDIKLFTEFLDYHNLKYNVNVWNNYSEDESEIQIYTSPQQVEFDNDKIFLFSSQRDLNFVKFVFVPTYKDKLNYLKKRENFNKKILDTFKNSSIQELISKFDQKKMNLDDYISSNFDYHEILLLYSVAKFSKFPEIMDHVIKYDQKVDNTFILRAKLNGLVDKDLIRCRSNNYKLNISVETLSEICKKADINIYA